LQLDAGLERRRVALFGLREVNRAGTHVATRPDVAPVTLDLRRREHVETIASVRVETPSKESTGVHNFSSSWAERTRPADRTGTEPARDPLEVRRMGCGVASRRSDPLSRDELRETTRCLARSFEARSGHDRDLRERGRNFAHGDDAFALYLTLAAQGGESELRAALGETMDAGDVAAIIEGMRRGIKEEIAAGNLPQTTIGPEEANYAILFYTMNGFLEEARRDVEYALSQPAQLRAAALRSLTIREESPRRDPGISRTRPNDTERVADRDVAETEPHAQS
jgi:hypothetical protein